MQYFFDSYALIEILQSNPSFEKYNAEEVHITVLNLIEVVYYFMQHLGEQKATVVCNKLRAKELDISNDVILSAVRFRNENKKKSLSYADCIGYIYAKMHNLVFLTGDDAFKNMPNVEFRK